MRAFLLAAAVLALAPATALAGDVVVEGRGWGHGIGLSQYGAYGYALRENRDHAWILGHYYRGTTLGTAPAARMRVRLRAARTLTLCGATAARSGGRRVRLDDGRRYRARLVSGRVRIRDARSPGPAVGLAGPVTVTGGSTTCLRGRAENGLAGGSYRGRMVLVPEGRRLVAVNHVLLEPYLYGVVAAEMPASWPAEALRAQAVVARSYALRSLRPGAAWDVYADVRSQVYGGLAAETPTTTAAIRATRGEVVRYGGEIAQTFFFSTSGGRTAGNEEEWGGTPIPYLRPVEDPHDDLSPYHEWTARFSAREAARALAPVTRGSLRSLRVASRTATGRAATVEIRGSGGTSTVSGAELRARLGLRSTWFTVR